MRRDLVASADPEWGKLDGGVQQRLLRGLRCQGWIYPNGAKTPRSLCSIEITEPD